MIQLAENFCGSQSKHAAAFNGDLYFLSDWNQRSLVKYPRRSISGGKVSQQPFLLSKQICDFCFMNQPNQSKLVSLTTLGWVSVDELPKLHLSSFEPANCWTSIASQGSSYFASGWNQDFMTSHVVAFTLSQGDFSFTSAVRYSLEVGESMQSKLG